MAMTVSPEVPVDGRVLASRFARHPVVSKVEVQRGSDLEDVRPPRPFQPGLNPICMTFEVTLEEWLPVS
jgi:hypothetical protein